MEALLEYLRQNEGPLAYAAIGLAAALEHLVPPFPGDTVTLFATFLAATAGYSGVLVYIVLVVGSIVGSLGPYALGLAMEEHEDRWPRWLRGPRTRKAIAAVRHRFEQRGAAYLTVNRFVPALRAFVFLAAGLARMRISEVVLFGGLSAALYNGLLLGVSYAIGSHWEDLVHVVQTYTAASLGILGAVVVAAVILRFVRARRSKGVDGEKPPSPE